MFAKLIVLVCTNSIWKLKSTIYHSRPERGNNNNPLICRHDCYFLCIPRLPTPELDSTLVKPDAEVPIPESTPSPDESRIVILIDEEEEEEPTAPTVTLLEDEGDEERRREEARLKESTFYCSHLSTLSCIASLHEHLHFYCSAALALQRLRRERYSHSNTQPPPLPPLPDPSPTQTPVTSPEKSPEVAPVRSEETVPADASPVTLDPITDPPILLEPSHTSSLPQHSYSETSLFKATATEDIPDSLPTDEPQDPVPRYMERVPETQTHTFTSTSFGSTFTSTPSLVLTPTASPLIPETTELLAPPTKEQPVHSIPTHIRPTEIPPPTELLVPGPEPPAGVEEVQHDVAHLAPQEEPMEEVQSTLQRTATDFYAELQNASEPSYGNGNGNHVHGSSQKESVFMRLNNRIKALEMNMSLSGRYLEELSQR